jgi:hypothetical protein
MNSFLETAPFLRDLGPVESSSRICVLRVECLQCGRTAQFAGVSPDWTDVPLCRRHADQWLKKEKERLAQGMGGRLN